MCVLYISNRNPFRALELVLVMVTPHRGLRFEQTRSSSNKTGAPGTLRVTNQKHLVRGVFDL